MPRIDNFLHRVVKDENSNFGWFDQVTLLDKNAVELIWNELESLLESINQSS